MSEIFELKSENEWRAAWPALQSLREDLTEKHFLESRTDLQSNGYQLFGLQSGGEIVSVAGLIVYPHVTRGRDCWLYDLATIPACRSKGFGGELLSHIESYARSCGCTRLHLHSRLHRADAHRFYEVHAEYERYAYVFKKDL